MRQFKITKNIMNRDATSLDKYLQEIWKVELITAEEEIQLAQAIKWWSVQALERLTKANLRFVVSVAKKYQNQWLSLPDIINEGNLWLIKAAKRFDETRWFKFISYAVRRIRQSILQALAEQARIVRLPLNRIGSINRINKKFASLTNANGYEPTEEMLAEALDLPLEQIKASMESSDGKHASLDAPSLVDEDITLWDSFAAEEAIRAPDSGLLFDSLRQEIESSLSTISEREADVIRLYFGLNGKHPLSLEEIAEQVDLTRERVRQIKEKAIRRLKHTSRSTQLKQYLG